MKFPFDNALRGTAGEYEISRVLGGFGALAYCACANVFVGYDVIILGKGFDITAYCLAFPGGLAAIIAVAAGSGALKDRSSATSRVIESTGSMPGLAQPSGPQEVQVVNKTTDPVPTEDQT